MSRKFALSTILNILAVSLPVGILLRIFGAAATVNPASARDILLIVGSGVFSFTLGMLSASLMRGVDRSPFRTIFLDSLEERHDSPGKRAA